jgi:NAD(P)-dependent dehydrogenase (short-subunit alcohol dehydrogenase family)
LTPLLDFFNVVNNRSGFNQERNSMPKLSGRTAIITGAGSGLGRASALLFAEEGAKIAAADVSEAPVKETVARIANQGGEAIALKVDVSKGAEVEEMVAATVRSFGKLDILFNNAGIYNPVPAHLMTEEQWDRTLDINLKGVFLGCRYALPELMKHGGVIVSTSSLAGIQGFNQVAHYCASKHGIVGLTKSLAMDYAQYNIRVNCICPGGMETNLTAHLSGSMSEEERRLMARQGARMHLLNRMADPAEVGRVALFLCTDDASFITGQAYVVDGGWTAGDPVR